MHAEEVDCEALFERNPIGQIVVLRHAGVVDKDIERLDTFYRRMNLRCVGHIQRQGSHARVRVFQGTRANPRINGLRSAFECLTYQCPTNATVRAGNQDCLILNVHGGSP